MRKGNRCFDSTETSVEKKTSESGHKSPVAFTRSRQGSPLTTKEITCERGKDLQEGLGNGPLKISGGDAETFTRNNKDQNVHDKSLTD